MKKVIITGANTGIGFALAKQLVVEHGCHVFLGSRSEEKGRQAVASIQSEAKSSSATGRVELLVIDVASEDSVRAAAASLASRGPFYALVNNAGVWSRDDPMWTLQVNVYGAKRVTDAFLPMLQKQGGRLLSTSSGAASQYVKGGRGFLPVEERKKICTDRNVTWDALQSLIDREVAGDFGEPEGDTRLWSVYGLSKAVLTSLHFIWARENPDLIVSCASPGFIATSMTAGFGAKLTPEQGTVSLRKLLFDDNLGEYPWIYYGSDGLKSPLDASRDPGTPEYEPGEWWKN